MKVALIKAPQVQSHVRGVGFYADRLLSHLKKIEGVEAELVAFSRNPARFAHYDVIHYTYFDITFPTYMPILGKPTIVTLHDLIPLKFPESFPLGRRGKVIWPVQKVLLSTASAIITDSYTSKEDIIALTRVPAKKIFPVYLAADPAYTVVNSETQRREVRTKYHLPKDYVLYVGGVNWNKNLPTLAKACEEGGFPLVIVGKEALGENLNLTHKESKAFSEFLEVALRYPNIHRLGFVPLNDLAAIYSMAMVYVQPSFYEGFGLPVLEAMACGAIIISGKNSSLAEIGGDATQYTDIESVATLKDKIATIKNLSPKEKSTLRTLSLHRAKEFTWDTAAKETYEIYKSVLA